MRLRRKYSMETQIDNSLDDASTTWTSLMYTTTNSAGFHFRIFFVNNFLRLDSHVNYVRCSAVSEAGVCHHVSGDWGLRLA